MAVNTLVIGLDAVSPKLLELWGGQGLLPNIHSLKDSGFVRPIETYLGFGDSVFWSSLVCGAHPGRNGHYFPVQFDALNYTLFQFRPDHHYGVEPYYQYCSKAGKRVAILDGYAAPLRLGLNGIMVRDWLPHDAMQAPGSWPSSLLDHLKQNYIDDIFGGNTEAELRSEQESLAFHQQIIERIEAKGRAAVDLLNSEPWDLFSVSFMEAHDLGHQSWHWHDPSCENHPKEAVAKHGNPMLATLQSMDEAVGNIIESAGAENVFLIAGLGMEKQCALNSVVQPILGQFCGIQGGRKELTDIRFRMPYFEVPHNMNSAMIRLNLKGRESQGLVEEADYDDTCQRLIERLWSISDVQTGECVVEQIVELHKTYPGDRSGNLPDLCIEWKKPLATKAVKIDDGTEFELELDFLPEMRQGDHDGSALIVSKHQYECADRVPVASIAPTICRTMGVNFPNPDQPALKLA